jgi:di/tricarboxylate transporter
MAILAVSIILLAAIALLVSERLPVDLTAIGIIVTLIVSGILTPREALLGFSNPAPITVAVLFVVSRGLLRTGVIDIISGTVIKFSKGDPGRLLFLTLFLVGGFSSFINNTPVVVLFMPIIMAACFEYSLSPSKFLMPVSFVSILAGTSTLIGTSTNIIVSDLAVRQGLAPIAMFELSVLGIPMAMAGAIFLYFLSPRLLGSHKEPVGEVRNSEKNRYISDLLISEESPLIGKVATTAISEEFPGVELFQIFRDYKLLDPERDRVVFQAGDEILIKATAKRLTQVLDSRAAILPSEENGTPLRPHDRKSMIIELVVQPNSDAVGRYIEDLSASLDIHIRVLGIKRHWKHYPATKVRNLSLEVGDIILVQTPVDHLDQPQKGASGHGHLSGHDFCDDGRMGRYPRIVHDRHAPHGAYRLPDASRSLQVHRFESADPDHRHNRTGRGPLQNRCCGSLYGSPAGNPSRDESARDTERFYTRDKRP